MKLRGRWTDRAEDQRKKAEARWRAKALGAALAFRFLGS
jgi:hypothetical protein